MLLPVLPSAGSSLNQSMSARETLDFHADLLRKYAPDAEWASCKSCGMRIMYIMRHAAHVHATCGSCKSCGSQIQLNEEDVAANKDAAPQDALRGKGVADTELMPNRRTWADALDTDQQVMVPDKPLSLKLGGGLGSLEGTYGKTGIYAPCIHWVARGTVYIM
jgi:predicted RNA-binding Zn-ribbon protein involved in translation (DUF1610 family)